MSTAVSTNIQTAFMQTLGRAEAAIRALAKPGVPPERIKRTIVMAVMKDNRLLQANPASVITAGLHLASLGLEIGGPSGEGYIVAYGPNAQAIVGYKGLVTLIVRGGILTNIQSATVFPGEEFTYTFGSDGALTHKPSLRDRDGDDYLGAWAGGFTPNGQQWVFDVMSKDEIEKVKLTNRNWAKSPWKQWPDMMRRKTVVRRLAKQLPMTAELAAAFELENRADGIAPSPTPIIDEIVIEKEPT